MEKLYENINNYFLIYNTYEQLLNKMENFTPQQQDKLDNIPQVYIDPEGTYKYVQISFNNKIYIRGIAKYKYHKGNYKHFVSELNALNLNRECKTKCLGGGRIQTNPHDKTIFVYGYSNAYGRCKHQITVNLLKEQYPTYNISWSNDGY
jgi:phosphohistidine phosphatase